jgi:hypothetical protein
MGVRKRPAWSPRLRYFAAVPKPPSVPASAGARLSSVRMNAGLGCACCVAAHSLQRRFACVGQLQLSYRHAAGTAFLIDALDGDRAEVGCSLTQLLGLLVSL